MVKETQKAKIERLEKELIEYRELLRKQDEEIYKMGCMANESFEKSPTFRQMQRRIGELETFSNGLRTFLKDEENKVKELRNKLYAKVKEVDTLKQQLEKNNENLGVKNVRGAGRKTKFTEQDKEAIKLYRAQGKTIKEIAGLYECSVGLIHKLINE
ncbi:MAG: Hin recombinase [Clostridium chrysemydis]|uniref:Hin recombinase n=1 Tax=Clostridium chrysemydis TaxID=2665504 RepID=UPI003F3BD706